MNFASSLVFGLLVLAVMLTGQAQAYCIERWACIQVKRSEQGVEFWASNRKAYPITATVTVRARNLRKEKAHKGKYEQTRVIEGHQAHLLLKLTAVNAARRFHYSHDFNWTPGDMYARHDKQAQYLLPYAKGDYYRIVQGFGGGYSHRGASRYAVDFAMPEGTPVHAARGGVVIDLTEHNRLGGASRRFSRYANFVTILHADRTTGEYYHLQRNGVAVELGDQVEAGQLIGYSGNTGFSSLPHLHFAVYRAKPRGGYESLPFTFSKTD